MCWTSCRSSSAVRLPTRHYTLLMVAQMPTADERSVWGEADAARRPTRTIRRWNLSEAYRGESEVPRSTTSFGDSPCVSDVAGLSNWFSTIASAAHHSGTARMSTTAEIGVCDPIPASMECQNLFVCDGAVIPASGIANTGLTIGALALRLAAHLEAGRAMARQRGRMTRRSAIRAGLDRPPMECCYMSLRSESPPGR